jgi:hypothetical protein
MTGTVARQRTHASHDPVGVAHQRPQGRGRFSLGSSWSGRGSNPPASPDMNRHEIETRSAEARQELLAAGNPGTYLVEAEIEPLRAALAAAPADDPLLSLVPDFVELPGSTFSVRRVSAYVLYGQVEGALAGETVARRAQRFADDFEKWRGAMLPNELVELYNRILDDAREAGSEDPFVLGDMRANTKPSGYSSLSGIYARATLEACAAALAPRASDGEPDAEPQATRAD